MSGIDRELLDTFVSESAEQLETLELSLISLEKHGHDAALLDTIFRAAHTLKGNAACVGDTSFASSAHSVEDVLDQLREGALPVSSENVSLLLQAVDVFRRRVATLAAGEFPHEIENPTLFARIAERSRLPAAKPPSVEMETFESSGESPPEKSSPAARRSVSPSAEQRRAKTLRIGTEKLDKLVNLIGQAAIARARLGNLLGRVQAQIGEEALEAYLDLERITSELEDRVLQTRVVPLGPIFKQYNRTVREVTQALGKRVELVLEGQDVEVDTSIAELLRDPLMHMIRNAVDHGIELPEVRKRLGKPECGRILLRAYHDGGNIVVEVNDDGGGVRRARVVERARRLGLCAEPEKLGDDELLRLILRPGFSTSETVTNLSGRGVGMDVVSRNIESLRGSLQITSVEGTGTAFSVRLPLSLAMIDGFSVGVDSETYILPLSAVTECVELSARDSAKAPSAVFDLRGSPLPCARLRDIFGFSGDAPERQSVVVVEHRQKRACLVVDKLLGEQKAVIKPLDRMFRNVPGIAASTICGNGRVALILDVPSLLERAAKVTRAVTPPGRLAAQG